MGRAIRYSRRVARETDNSPAKALAQEPELIREALRILYISYAPWICGAGPPSGRPEGTRAALSISRTRSSMLKDAARVGSIFLRTFHASYGYLTEYNLPVSKGAAPANSPQKPSAPPPPMRPPRDRRAPAPSPSEEKDASPANPRPPWEAPGKGAVWRGPLVKMVGAPC